MHRERWLIAGINKRSSQDKNYSLTELSNVLDKYGNKYDNHITTGEFHTETDDTDLNYPIVNDNQYNLIKVKTCFKSAPGKWTDFVLTNHKFPFKNIGPVKTGLGDFYHMIYTSMKSVLRYLLPRKYFTGTFKTTTKKTFQRISKKSLSKIEYGNHSQFGRGFARLFHLDAAKNIKRNQKQETMFLMFYKKLL